MDGTVRLWNPDTGKLLLTRTGNGGAITCLYQDDHEVLSGSDGDFEMWGISDEAETPQVLLKGVAGWAGSV